MTLTDQCLQLLWMWGKSTLTRGSRSCFQWVDDTLNESSDFYKGEHELQLHLAEIGSQYINKHLLIQTRQIIHTDLAVHITPTTTCHILNSVVYFPTLPLTICFSPSLTHTVFLHTIASPEGCDGGVTLVSSSPLKVHIVCSNMTWQRTSWHSLLLSALLFVFFAYQPTVLFAHIWTCRC